MNAWQAYTPDEKNPWTLAKVGHLYRRAGFGATQAELHEGLKLGPAKLVDKLLKPAGDLAAFDAESERWSKPIRRNNNDAQAAEWWIYRMLRSPHPLRENLTLFWHNHFATSNAKVLNIGQMLGQYDLMYANALCKFDVLLQGISKDPAMMVWLDTVQSKKGMPNENYARELMELFSLGIGHYTETDIREAARAFTGWEVRNNAFFENKAQFDSTPKSVMGRKGNFKGDDIVKICLDQPACASFIVTKLFRFLVSETIEPSKELIAPLVEAYRKDYDTGKLVETMLRSNLFFSPEAYRSIVKSPVAYVCGIVKGFDAHIGMANLSLALRDMGQHLFHPPSVKGWDGGQAWLNGQTLLTRQNFALALCETRQRDEGAADSKPLPARLEGEPLTTFLEIFLQKDVPAATRERLNAFAKADRKDYPAFWSADRAAEHRAISLCHLVLTLPEMQLC